MLIIIIIVMSDSYLCDCGRSSVNAAASVSPKSLSYMVSQTQKAVEECEPIARGFRGFVAVHLFNARATGFFPWKLPPSGCPLRLGHDAQGHVSSLGQAVVTCSTDGSSISEVAVVRPMGKMLQWQSVASSPSRFLALGLALWEGLP